MSTSKESDQVNYQSNASSSSSIIDHYVIDSPVKALFGRKHLRRRSSLFYKNEETKMISAVSNDPSESEQTETKKAVNSRRKRRLTSICRRKSMCRTRSRAEILKFEITCEPPPVSLKPILQRATQQAARRISMKARGWNKHRHVHFHSKPSIHDISPRSGKIPGVVKMPDSPPNAKNIVNLIATANVECDVPDVETDISLSNTSSKMPENEVVRFLPVAAQTFQCDPEKETIFEECPKVRNDADDEEVVEIIACGDHISSTEPMEIDNLVNDEIAVDQSESNPREEKVATSKIKRCMEPTVTWVRGDRLRSRVNWMDEEKNGNKENKISNLLDGKEDGDIQRNNRLSTVGIRHIRPSVFPVPREGPYTKVKKWLNKIPEDGKQLKDEEIIKLEQQHLNDDIEGSKVQLDAFDILLRKQSSSLCKPDFGAQFGSEKKLDEKGNKRCRRSVCTGKPVIEQLAPKHRRQTIVAGEMKACLNERKIVETDDDVVFVCDQPEKKDTTPGKSLVSKKEETIPESSARKALSSASGDKVNWETYCNSKSQKKSVVMNEMDFAPFPSISFVGYGEIPPVNYDLPFEFRQKSVPRTDDICTDNVLQMIFRNKDRNKNMEEQQKTTVIDKRFALRSRSTRRNRRKSGILGSHTKELQQNTWTEALRPLKTDDLITDGTTVRELCSWIRTWKERLQKSRNCKGDSRIEKNRKKRHDSSSYDYFDTDEEGEILCNTAAIVYGPCGSGKTSLVYAVAKCYGMHVLETASNERRSCGQLKSKLEGATHSHKFSMASVMSQMFIQNEKNEREMVEDSVILVDDCDVVYDKQDDGFWPTLRVLCKEARIPIIITCEDIALVRQELGLEIPVSEFSLTRPTSHTVSSKLQMLCASVLNINVSSDICTALAEHYNGDLRACINQLQFYSAEDSSNSSLNTLLSYLKSEEQSEFKALSEKRFPVSYNVAVRYDHSYEPESVLPSVDRMDEKMEIVEKNDIHDAVKITRSVLPAIEYFPLSDVILDYMPYLCIMNEASRKKMPSSRRALHYFDELHGDSQIDPSGTMKVALTHYFLRT